MEAGEIVARFERGEPMGILAEQLGMTLEDLLCTIAQERKRRNARIRAVETHPSSVKPGRHWYPVDPYVQWMPPEPKVPPGGRDRLLRAAVLEQAVRDAKDGDASAIRWIWGQSTSEPGFSCEAICDVLGVEVEDVRRVVARARGRWFQAVETVSRR